MESLLLLLLVTLVALAALLVGLPELLLWLNDRNARQRHELTQAARRLESDLQIAARQVEPFRSLQAPQYRHIYETTAGLLRDVQAARHALVTASRLRFPQVPTAVWPVQHFAVYPSDAAGIMTTFWQLRRLHRSLAAGNRSLGLVQKQVEQLRQMPAQFKQESAALLAQLETIHQTIQAEQQAGVAALADMVAEHGRLQQAARAVERQLAQATSLSLEQADQIGQEIDRLETAAADLARRAQAVHQERSALDAQRQAVQSAWSALGQTPPTLKPISDLVGKLLAEATELRRRADFAQAATLLKACAPWIELVKAFQATDAHVAQLRPLQHSTLNPAAIEQVQAALQQAYQILAELDESGRRQPYTPPPPAMTETAAGLMTTLAQIQAQARQVQVYYNREVQEQEQHARLQERALNQAWQRLGRLMKLDKNDRLAQQYATLQTARKEVAGKPAHLRSWIWEAAELQQDILDSADYLQYRLEHVSAWVNQLPAYVVELEDAGVMAWGCLQPQAADIRRMVQDLQQRWKRARTGWLDETHEELDAMKLQYQQLQDAFQTVDHNLYQLNELHGRIQATMSMIQATAEHLNPAQFTQMELAVDRHARAFEALTCDQALTLLRQAEEFANRLVTR